MAMTAWSAKVFSSSICESVKGRATILWTEITPMTAASRSMGTARSVMDVRTHLTPCPGVVGVSEGIRDMHDPVLENCPPCRGPSIQSDGVPLRELNDFWGDPATGHYLVILRILAVHLTRVGAASLTALSISVSSTGWRSKVERLITLSTSAVAVCCSRASVPARVRQ
jgi:hypothetical protein